MYAIDDNDFLIVDAQEILGKYFFPENGPKDTNEKGSFNERSDMDTLAPVDRSKSKSRGQTNLSPQKTRHLFVYSNNSGDQVQPPSLVSVQCYIWYTRV